jgi:hypothetical protein
MTRLAHAWRAMRREQRLVALAALSLLVTMFLPWYGLQSLDRKTGVIHSHSISAFGDVSFVEAAIFLVAVGVSAIVFARGEGRDFHLPGGDGLIVMAAGCWAGLLIFYRVFSRPSGGGYPVGIEWGFFLAFVAAGAMCVAGLRMRASARPDAPLRRSRSRAPRPAAATPARSAPADPLREPIAARGGRPTPVPARERAPHPPEPTPAQGQTVAARARPRYPPAPPQPPGSSRRAERARAGRGEPDGAGEQLSFEDPPTR